MKGYALINRRFNIAPMMESGDSRQIVFDI
jgi:hypothetical protein